MRSITVSVGGLAAASANNICLSQGPTSGAATINGAAASGGVATLDTCRFIIVTSAGDDSALTWTATGTDWAGSPITDVFAGANTGAARSNLCFKTVTGVSSSTTTADAFTVGTNGMASSPYVRMDEYAFGPTFVHVNVSGTVDYTVQGTNDDPNDVAGSVARYQMTWLQDAFPAVSSAATTTLQFTMPVMPKFARVVLNSGTGTVTASFTQFASAT